ncbi:MAG: M24 family metallopeptidase C-terminal domain-containing protein, partial [Lachnospiraceae bacterium]|nr:M24 family metallopeptidase C-terminal domain-containing protein [Lachnospiraceae bacterium]
RIENELICRKAEKNEYGQFMCFEDITYAPIDLEAIIPEEMTAQEKKWLNDYHANVYKTISPYLTEKEKEWLKENTRAI